MNIDVIPTTEVHVESLAPRLRPQDVAELRASTGFSPRVVLAESVNFSDWCKTVMLDGVPIAIFGIAPILPGAQDVGTPWLLAAPELETIWVRFLKESREYVAQMLTEYPILTNWVDLRNVTACRWIEWCGFKPVKVELEYGYEKIPFMQYARFADV